MKSEELAEFRFSGDDNQLKVLRAQLRDLLSEQGLNSSSVDRLVLALQEAIANVVLHAYHGDESGRMHLHVNRQGNELDFLLVDFAHAVSHQQLRAKKLRDFTPGGLGLHIIEKFMDGMELMPPGPGEGNVLKLTKRLENHEGNR